MSLTRQRVVILAAIYLVVATVFPLFGGQAQAGNSLYDMRALLAAPHPFLTRDEAPPPAIGNVRARRVGGKRVNQGDSPAQEINKDDEENLDLDNLPKSENGDQEELDINDPLEPMNRVIFAVNEVFNYFILEPVAKSYNFIFPQFLRDGISNFLTNLNNPVILINDLLQGEFERGLDTSARLVINSTIGAAGLFDVADSLGFKKHNEDFGQTMAVWGVGEGFYLVLPLLGPSNPRDALGKFVVDSYFDPLGYYLDNTGRDDSALSITVVRGVVTYADIVEDLDNLRETSIDFYGALRSLYRQRRMAEISNSDDGVVPTIDSYSK